MVSENVWIHKFLLDLFVLLLPLSLKKFLIFPGILSLSLFLLEIYSFDVFFTQEVLCAGDRS